MARSCGLRVGPRRYELVVLDGSAKKHKFVAHSSGELPRDTDGGAAAAQVLADALREANVPRDNVGLVIDAGLAAFRSMKLPFSDREKIEEVLKFEVESHLPQWNVDDVVVDYLVQEESTDQSELLVTAVRKEDLRSVLSLCELAGFEPLEAELETSAMINAAFTAGVCEIDKAQLLVHVGESSTSVVVVDGRKVREMRAIRIGAMTHGVAQAAETEPAAAAAEAPAPASPAESARRHEAAIQRIVRELSRTLSAARTVHPIEAVYVCGQELSGLVGSKLQDVEVRRLEVLPADSGITAEDAGPLVVAYGAAVRQLGGGVLQPKLRREELRYAGMMERVELPLAVAALLAVTLMCVWFIFLHKEQTFLADRLGMWSRYTQAFLLGDLRAGSQGYLVHPSDKLKTYIQKIDEDTDRNPFERLQYVNGQLKEEIKKMEKDLGQDAEITQPQSALAGASLVLAVLETQLTDENRPSLRKLQSTYTIGRQGKGDYVRVQMDVSFFAEDAVQATQNYEEFVKALQSRPWCLNFDRRPSTTLENSKGIFVAGMGIDVDITKANLEKLAQ